MGYRLGKKMARTTTLARSGGCTISHFQKGAKNFPLISADSLAFTIQHRVQCFANVLRG